MDQARKAEDGADVKSTRDVLKKWNDYYINNDFGIGIQCDKCKKWRKVYQYQDRTEVPDVWICSMWKMDRFRRGSCRIPSDLNEDHFSAALYSPGSLVWAKSGNYPWWPAMIEDCPDLQDFFIPYVDSEHEYHVHFFGKKPLRNWIKESRIKEFSTPLPMTPKAKKNKDLQMSIEQANEAQKMRPKERLKKYSFADRYKGHWAKVKELDDVDLPPNCLKRRRLEEYADFGSQLATEVPRANRSSEPTPTVRKVRRSKSKSEVASKRKSVDKVGSIEPERNGFPEDPEKEENFEDDSSKFRPQMKAEKPHANQDYHRKSMVRKVRNVKSKSKAATNRKSMDKEEFQPVQKSVGTKSESSSDSRKETNSEEQDSSKFRSQVMAKKLHFNQDCLTTVTVWNIMKAKSKSEAATMRKSVGKEEFQPVRQSVGAIRGSSSDSEKEEQDSSELKSQSMTKESRFNQDCVTSITVWKANNAKSKAATNRAPVDKEEFQPVQQSVKAARGSSSDSEKEEQDSSEFRSQVITKKSHFNQDCPTTLTVWEASNAKSKAASNRAPVDKEKFQPVQQSVEAISESSSESEKEENNEKQDLPEFKSQAMTKKVHFNQDCPTALTVWKARNAKSKAATNRKFVYKGQFQPGQQSNKHKRRECPGDSEENSEEENSYEFRPLVMAEEPHANQDCHRTSTARNVEGKSESSSLSTKRKLVDKKEFQSVQQSIKHKRSESSTDSEKEESEEENSSEFRPQVMAEEPHVNQDYYRTSTAKNVEGKLEDASNRKLLDDEEFQSVPQSIKLKRSESSTDSEKEESEEEESFEFRPQIMAEEPPVNQDCYRTSTARNVEGKLEDASNRKLLDDEESQSVPQSIKHKRSESSTDSEKEESEEESPVLKNTTKFSDNGEGDSSVDSNSTILSESEEEESPEVKAYAEFLKKKYPPSTFLADANLSSVSGTGGYSSRRSSDSTVHDKQEDNFSKNGSVTNPENATELLENDTVIHHENATEYSQNDSGANILDSDASLHRTQNQFCSTPKNEKFSDRSGRFKKNRELTNSNNSKYMPYSFYRGRIKK